jgi:dTDP-4-dehydrorhamnose reductase
MKKIMILGSGGMLGHMVYYYLNSLEKYTIVDASFPQKLHEGSKLLDVTNSAELEKYITKEKPDVIVNCIGILIKGSQIDPSNAVYLNSYFPHQVAKILRKTGGKLIHISTDCVFSGAKGSYTENDFRDADDTYGRSKALGEVINGTDITLRTSIIGPELKEQGEGLFHWFMQQNEKINGYSNVFWGGVTTLELAKVINNVIGLNISGLIHVTNGQAISKFDLLKLFNKYFRKEKLVINSIDDKFSNKSLISIRKDINLNVHSYEKMIEELREVIENNIKLYERYFK